MDKQEKHKAPIHFRKYGVSCALPSQPNIANIFETKREVGPLMVRRGGPVARSYMGILPDLQPNGRPRSGKVVGHGAPFKHSRLKILKFEIGLSTFPLVGQFPLERWDQFLHNFDLIRRWSRGRALLRGGNHPSLGCLGFLGWLGSLGLLFTPLPTSWWLRQRNLIKLIGFMLVRTWLGWQRWFGHVTGLARLGTPSFLGQVLVTLPLIHRSFPGSLGFRGCVVCFWVCCLLAFLGSLLGRTIRNRNRGLGGLTLALLGSPSWRFFGNLLTAPTPAWFHLLTFFNSLSFLSLTLLAFAWAFPFPLSFFANGLFLTTLCLTPSSGPLPFLAARSFSCSRRVRTWGPKELLCKSYKIKSSR